MSKMFQFTMLLLIFKSDKNVFGADVSMLLNLQPGRLLIAIVERGQALSAVEG